VAAEFTRSGTHERRGVDFADCAETADSLPSQVAAGCLTLRPRGRRGLQYFVQSTGLELSRIL
jgi:hypothetical protein